MLTVYWICLLGGLAFTVVSLLVGDLLEGVLDALDGLDGLLDPMSLIGGITAFGGAGVILETSTGLGTGAAAGLAAGIGLVLAVLMHFLYVRPMKAGESSTGFSLQEYRGRIGEVLTTIPARGFGEVLIHIGHSNTFREAASFNRTEIPSGTTIVVVDIIDGDLFVTPFEEEPAVLEAPDHPAGSATLLTS